MYLSEVDNHDNQLNRPESSRVRQLIQFTSSLSQNRTYGPRIRLLSILPSKFLSRCVHKYGDLSSQKFGKIRDGLPVDFGWPFVGFDLGKGLKQSLLIQHAVVKTVVYCRDTCSCVSLSLPCSSRLRSWPGSHRLLSQRAIYDSLSRLL